MTLTKRLAAIGVAGVLTAAVTMSALAPAIAQDAAPDTTPDTTQESESKRERRQEARAERQAAFASALAEELDLPVERVRTALDNVHDEFAAEAKARHFAHLKERLDAAVADGKLTREQADAMYAAAESGVMPFGGRGGHRGHGGPGGSGHHRGGPAPAESEADSA